MTIELLSRSGNLSWVLAAETTEKDIMMGPSLRSLRSFVVQTALSRSKENRGLRGWTRMEKRALQGLVWVRPTSRG